MTNIILVAVGFVFVTTGMFLFRKRTLLILFVSVGLILVAFPFARHAYLTRDAYEWTIIVDRAAGTSGEQQSIYIQRIEWITDYETLKRQRGHVGSVLLDEDTSRKEWQGRGYVPLSIRAEILRGSSERGISRTFTGLPPGSYTFTLIFDENDIGTWSIEAE